MEVEVAIGEHLAADGAVAALVGARIYQLVLPQRPTLPAIRIQLISDPVPSHLRGTVKRTAARVQIDAYAAEASGADPYAEVASVAAAVHDAMTERASFQLGSPAEIEIGGAFRVNRTALYEPGELRQVRMLLDYIVWSKALT